MKENVDVAIIMGSDSDLSIMKDAAKFLEDMGISYEMTILSVMFIIAVACGEAHLPGVFADQVPCPVIGVPIMSKTLNGIDSLYSIVQMPSGIPVATVAINGAKNAGILAATIISTSNDEVYNKICDYKASMNNTVLEKNEKLQKLGYESYLNDMKK